MFRGGEVVLFEIPELDYMKTKRNVLKVIRKFDRCLAKIESNSRPKLTPSYSLEMIGGSSGFHSRTENTAIFNVEDALTPLGYVCRVLWNLNRMNLDLRLIIWYSFFEGETNERVAERVNMSLSKLKAEKKMAVEIFAIAMDVEVYEK